MTSAPRPQLARRAAWALRDWVYAALWQARSLGPTSAADYRDGTAQPVVVLPGVYETWHFLRPLIDPLHAEGHPIHVVPALRHNVRAVPDSARAVMDVIEGEDLRDVLLLAHSKGALIGKYAMAHLDPDRRIDRMIAVAAPFAGSAYARFAPLRHLRAFDTGDPVLAALGREIEANARITSIYGIFDTMIPSGSELPGATNRVLPIAGHFSILGDPHTRQAVLEAARARPR